MKEVIRKREDACRHAARVHRGNLSAGAIADVERQVQDRSGVGGRFWQISPDLLGVLNADGCFERANPAWETVLGWSEAEVCSKSTFELLHPEIANVREPASSISSRATPSSVTCPYMIGLRCCSTHLRGGRTIAGAKADAFLAAGCARLGLLPAGIAIYDDRW